MLKYPIIHNSGEAPTLPTIQTLLTHPIRYHQHFTILLNVLPQSILIFAWILTMPTDVFPSPMNSLEKKSTFLSYASHVYVSPTQICRES